MKIVKLTFLAFYLNSAMDSGRYDDLSLDEMNQHIEAKNVFEFLAERLKGDIDLSLYSADEIDELSEEWLDMMIALDERRKMGIGNRGLTLLIAYLLEGVQRRLP